VRYNFIPWLLEQEKDSDFQSVHQNWRPRNLLFVRQTQVLLQDVRFRLDTLELAHSELQTLHYADRYIKYLRRMRLWVRQAGFSWQADQLKFLKSVVGFYSDYGAVLRLLKADQLRGKFLEPATTQETGV
jgi:hypothetical protein